MVWVAVQVAGGLQVWPLVAVAQVALAQVPQRVALLHAPTEQLVAPVHQMMRHALVPCMSGMMHAMDVGVRVMSRVLRHGVRFSDADMKAVTRCVLALPLPHDISLAPVDLQ